jgi:hypothetical protein
MIRGSILERHSLETRGLILAAVLSLTCLTQAQPSCVMAEYEGPALDRWMYPFNQTPGVRWTSSLFGNIGEEADPDFDQRDGQMIIGYDTGQEVPIDLGVGTYQTRTLMIVLQNDGQHQIAYDPTQDPWQSYLDPSDPEYIPDPDPGRPIEMFGAGFRNGWTAATFLEGSSYAPNGAQFGQNIRNVYPVCFDPIGMPLDVSNNVQEGFDPHVWAIGRIDGLQPGEDIPTLTDIVFEVDVHDPYIQQYLAEAMNEGHLRMVVTSLHTASVMDGLFPTIVNKEHPFADGEARAEIDVRLGNPADVNCDGIVNVGDLVDVILGWGNCADGCSPDVNLDGDVTVQDLVAVILGWD